MNEAQGAGGRREAAEVPGTASPPGRVRARRLRCRDQADADRRVQPVVPRDAVDHRDAGVGAGEGRRPRGPASGPRSATSSPSTRFDLDILRDLLDAGGVDVTEPVRRRPGSRWSAVALAPPPTPEEQEERLRHVGSGRPARPRVALPAEGSPRRPARGPGQRPDAVEAGPRPAAAGGDHPGAGGGAAAQGQRADRVHQDRRVRPGRRRAQAAGAADPGAATRRGRSRRKTGAKASSCSSTSRGSPRGKQRVLDSDVWEAHRLAHRRNFYRRFSETAEEVDPDSRLKPPRYWLVHTLAHVLIREMAMQCGYSAASLSERLYAWPATDERPPAAGLLIVTTASDSDGTLGGLVAAERAGTAAAGGVVGTGAGDAVLVGPDLRQADAGGPGGFPARGGVPLLRDGVGDVLRAGEPVPGPAVPHQPAGERAWVLRTNRLVQRLRLGVCSLERKPGRSPITCVTGTR